MRTRLGRLIYLLPAVSAVYWNRIVLNNIDKSKNDGINGMPTIMTEPTRVELLVVPQSYQLLAYCKHS